MRLFLSQCFDHTRERYMRLITETANEKLQKKYNSCCGRVLTMLPRIIPGLLALKVMGFKSWNETPTCETQLHTMNSTWDDEAVEGFKSYGLPIDFDYEFASMFAYECGVGLDRMLFDELISRIEPYAETIDFSKLNGADEMAKTGELIVEIQKRINDIHRDTRIAAANFALVSTPICNLLRKKYLSVSDENDIRHYSPDSMLSVIVEDAMLNNGETTLYRDANTLTDYILLGYRGETNDQCGLTWVPDIPVFMKPVGSDELGIEKFHTESIFGIVENYPEKFYRLIKVEGVPKQKTEIKTYKEM